MKCPSLLFFLSARWRKTGSMWPWSLTGYSSGCLYWCVYWDLWDSFFLPGWLEWFKISSSREKSKNTDMSQQRKHPSAPLHFDIELCRLSCHRQEKQWWTDFDHFTTANNNTERPRHCELYSVWSLVFISIDNSTVDS